MDNELKNKVDKIWIDLATAGITNPLSVIEQITYLLFIKSLDDIEISKEKNDNLLGITSKRIFDADHQAIDFVGVPRVCGILRFCFVCVEVGGFLREDVKKQPSNF